MASATNKDENDEIQPPQRPPSPPPHTTFAARGIHPPTFSAFKPRDYRIPNSQGMNHVAWNCDGKKLAAVGVDKATRVWNPDKSMEHRSAQMFSGGHSDDVDYVSWNPTHPELFCTSSQKDRRIVFWDARQSRNIQQISLKSTPIYTTYSPDGRTIMISSMGNTVSFLTFGKEGEDSKEQWRLGEKSPTNGSCGLFNHAGDGFVLALINDHSIRVLDYPSMELRETTPAHVGGTTALALDPRGRYLATGGYDSIVNLFDVNDWISAKTLTSSDHSITSVSFSFDGEYLAIASAGSYIDICATETCVPLHRVPALGPAPSVSWHPSKYIVAYCGQTKPKESGPPPVSVVSLFGLLDS
ncbi:WD40 repeat-like protein [Marasmius fiardii PR-910]|nr:WD40 repeat-like protein [Marasmius fiardii PR-910]